MNVIRCGVSNFVFSITEILGGDGSVNALFKLSSIKFEMSVHWKDFGFVV